MTYVYDIDAPGGDIRRDQNAAAPIAGEVNPRADRDFARDSLLLHL
jgi:hypothetical protein